ncbi:heavy metal translocating P-type ATPase [Cupriavidus sp. AU9028]|uniref:heavy metal translocating P-type ATPase n=1 Tax=Cupriavidus sp. AU9028 TaxID=2871157 RepID=UPI001C97E2DA|nr:heavy metal translocating P-type ATPase [Cupriavidus sp. AU9028]MBY4898093.1 heavy metal translocating P-type ATPase [Cupriavidus sp. AU9028]
MPFTSLSTSTPPASAALAGGGSVPLAAGASAAVDRLCFHCGQPAVERPLHAEVGGARRRFCCIGCRTVAQSLDAAGFAHLYGEAGAEPVRFARPIDAERREAAMPLWAAYDTAELRTRFVRALADGRADITLSVDNIRCAACAWLIEQTLSRLSGVESAIANVATRRVVVRWRLDAQPVAGLLAALADIGYEAWPFESSRADQRDRAERRSLLMRMAVAMLGMMQVMMYAWPVYTHEGSIDAGHLQLLRWASLLLTLPVVLYSAAPIFASAWRGVKARHAGMDLPVSIGLAAAFGASLVATLRGTGEVYYDSVTMFVALLLLARYLELRVRQAARSGAEMLARQLPATCDLLGAQGRVERVPVARLQPGQLIRVAAGEVVPADGVVIAGQSELDEAMLTGESRPVPRGPGDTVLAGCYNTASQLEIEVRQVGAGTRIAEIVAVLDRALADKPRLAALADRVAAAFVLALLVLSLGTALGWWWVDPQRALMAAVAVLVVSCPCALSLATPAALAAAGAALARGGLLVTRGHTLETLCRVTDVVLDKTGTLTEGRFIVAGVVSFGALPDDRCLALAAALEGGARHPIAQALCRAAGASAAALAGRIGEIRETPGQGVQAQVDGRAVRLGTPAFVASLATRGELPDEAALRRSLHDGATAVWLGDADGPLAAFVLADTERAQSAALLAALRRLGVRIHLVSGDEEATVRWWADHFGIASAQGRVSPEGKRAWVERLQQSGAVVLAVGDGINDAPVLAQAQVSVALGSGAPLAQAGADAVLTHDGLARIADAIGMARRTRRVVRQNLAWAFGYNLLAIPLAASGHLTAWMAGIGMSLSSLLVVANAARLLRDRGAVALTDRS